MKTVAFAGMVASSTSMGILCAMPGGAHMGLFGSIAIVGAVVALVASEACR